MKKIKIGDYVRFKKYAFEYHWATKDVYRVVGYEQYDNEILILDKPLMVQGNEDYTVHVNYMVEDLKYARQKKLERIFND